MMSPILNLVIFEFPEIDDTSDIEQTVYCKKVRRAQEAKGLTLSMPSPKMNQSPEMKPTTLSPASLLMRPPLSEAPTDLSVSSSDLHGNECEPSNAHLLQIPTKRGGISLAGRIKKLRFNKHASVAGMNETKVDDIATDIIIPRERVVSICNMDKDALDDYLNEGGDSQEQEAELLQYFQTTANQEKSQHNATTATETIVSTSTAPMTSGSVTNPPATTTTTTAAFPLLENYQLHANAGVDGEVMVVTHTQSSNLPAPAHLPPRKQDQINQLRQYLQQNLHQSGGDRTVVTSSSQISSTGGGGGGGGHFHGGWKTGGASMHSASNSLTALSLPYQQASSSHDHHQTETTSIGAVGVNHTESKVLPVVSHASQMGGHRASAAIIQNTVHDSPNARSKNFNFVPISPGPQSPRVQSQNTAQLHSNLHAIHNQRNTFLSPRRSPAVRKLANKDLSSLNLKSLQDPSISTLDTAYKNEISASAPASPSMTPHHFQFNTNLMQTYGSTSTASSTQQTQPPHQHQAACSITGMCPALERSQSVPLHCQSPAFNRPIVSNTAYNSVCNSVVQTPVPSEFADFSEDNILDMLAESSNDQIKVETNEMSNLMQSDCIRSNISRSVPSTPLPMHHGFHLNSLSNFALNASVTSSGGHFSSGLLMTTIAKQAMDNSKSVPTTPCVLANNSTPFRYSPEHHRDFLINGNTIDAAKGNPFYGQQTQSPATSNATQQAQRNAQHQHQHSSITSSSAQVLLTTNTQPIEELPNYSDINDPIIEGSHLMNNL